MSNPHMNRIQLCADGEGQHTWGFVYFHRKAEHHVEKNHKGKWVAPDLVTSSTHILDKVKDGIHAVYVYNEKATLYLWNKGTRGLVCLDTDARAILEATQKYTDKVTSL